MSIHVEPKDKKFRRRTTVRRPPNNPGELVDANQPVLFSGSQSFYVKGLKESDAKILTAHQRKPRLYMKFWRDLGLNVYAPNVSATSFGSFRECPRKFMWAKRLRLADERYSPALAIGVSFHELLAELHWGSELSSLPQYIAHKVSGIQDKLIEAADKSGLLPNGKTVSEQIAIVEKDIKLATAMVAVFRHYLPLEQLQNHYDILSIEEPYSIKMTGISVPITIRTDLILRNKQTKALWIVDHKTTAVKPSILAASMPFDLQTRLYKYVLFVHQCITHPERQTRIGGVIHNIIQKPSIRQTKNESYDEYVQRVYDWYSEQRDLYPNDPPIQQSVIPHKGPLLDEELLVQIHQTGWASNAILDLSRFYRDSKACLGKFGNSPCPFLPLCRNDDDNVDTWSKILCKNYHQTQPQESEVVGDSSE